jgi:caffeoyl-CoA O-methyltransferase
MSRKDHRMQALVPKNIERYAVDHSTPESNIFQSLTQQTRAESDSPQMLVGPIEGRFLKLIVKAMEARRVLEIGTFTGYSALMMAEGVADGGEVITCDISSESTKIARAYWDQSPHGRKITLLLGRALDTIAGVDGPLDVVFIDADKQNYIAYWNACVPKVRKGGVVLADNVLWSGRVLDPREPDDHALVAFNKHVRGDDRVETVMLPFRDGVTMSIKL